MNTAYLPAFAALAGSAIGGLTSFASAWLTQHLLSPGVVSAAFEEFVGIWQRNASELRSLFFNEPASFADGFESPFGRSLHVTETQEVQRCTSIQSCYHASSSPG